MAAAAQLPVTCTAAVSSSSSSGMQAIRELVGLAQRLSSCLYGSWPAEARLQLLLMLCELLASSNAGRRFIEDRLDAKREAKKKVRLLLVAALWCHQKGRSNQSSHLLVRLQTSLLHSVLAPPADHDGWPLPVVWCGLQVAEIRAKINKAKKEAVEAAKVAAKEAKAAKKAGGGSGKAGGSAAPSVDEAPAGACLSGWLCSCAQCRQGGG
jgi:hypothetical protein